MREYRKRNPEKIKEINQRYWNRRATMEQEEKKRESASD